MIARSGKTRTAIIAVLVLAVVAGAGYFAVSAARTHKKPPPRTSRELPPPVSLGEQWKQKLAKEPCDRKLVLRAAQELLKDNTPSETIAVVDTYNANCPPFERLFWEKYAAHERLGQFDKAAEAASKLIEFDPDDQDYYWWRGKVQLAGGKLPEAEADFVQALAIMPNARSIPFDLADVYEKQRRPCDALRVLDDYMSYHPTRGSYPALDARIERLRKEGSCVTTTGEGKTVTLKFPPKASTIPVKATINGVEGLFILDTGATVVVVTRRFADKLGIPKEPATLRVSTANGRTRMQLAMADIIKVRGARAQKVPIAIADTTDEAMADGLLGMGFLGRFDMRVSTERGLLELAPRELRVPAPEARQAP